MILIILALAKLKLSILFTVTKPYKYKGYPSQFRAFCDNFKNRSVEVGDPQQKLELLFSMVEGEAGKVVEIYRCHADPVVGLSGAL